MSGIQSHSPLIRWRWIAVFWTAAAAFEASQSVLIQHALGKQGKELLLFATEMAGWLPWMLATPFIIGLARRHPIIPAPTPRGVAAHLLALVAITMIAEIWSAALQMLFNPWSHRHAPAFWDTLGANLVFHGLICLFAYALILAVTYLIDSRDKVARKVTETAHLNEQLSKAQLAALRQQMEPHFMFNTLNSIAGLVRDNRSDAAVGMIVGLSEFLRHSIKDGDRHQVTLAEEVEYLGRYVEIQQARFGERLRFSVEIKPDTLHLAVPSLLLQPLVENAIKHGLGKTASGGNVRVKGVRDGGALMLSVYNDGPAFPPDWETNSDGVGLANLRTRLRILHGTAAELSMRRVGRKGVEVLVAIPAGGA